MKTRMRLVNGLTGDLFRGDGTPVLLVHGMWEGSWIFDEWAEYLNERGHAVYNLNLRGHWGSRPCDLGKVRIADYVTDVLDMIEEIKEATGQDPIVIGHSLGALVGILASERTKVQALVLVAPAAPAGMKLNWAVAWAVLKHPFRYLWNMIWSKQFMMHRRDLRLMRSKSEASSLRYKQLVPESGRAARELVFNPPKVAYPFSQPTLVVAGAEDRLSLLVNNQTLATLGKAEFIRLPWTGHVPMCELGSRSRAAKVYFEFLDKLQVMTV